MAGLAFFDLDGTLLDNDRDIIPESSLKALELLRRGGWRIVLSTGRDMDTHYSIRYRSIVRPDAVIHQNGGKVTVGDKLLYKHVMDKKLLSEILSFCREKGFCMGSSVGDKDYFINPEKKTAADRAYNRFIERHFVPFEGLLDPDIEVVGLSFAGNIQEEKPQIEKHFPQLELFAFSSNAGADVVERGFSKAEGMKRLCSYYDAEGEQTVAFGDSPNDIALLKAADIGVAMGNADEAVKRAADHVTDDIRHDGIFNACRYLGMI
ncbi:MAG: HAD family hydrolase [Clostridiales bacterium]|nr:HAD family hydrolase [Clostridiales bacterium]